MDRPSPSLSPGSSRGRKPVDDSEAARIKRQKAAERQRRKRKRDRESIAFAVQALQNNPALQKTAALQSNPVYDQSPPTSLPSLPSIIQSELLQTQDPSTPIASTSSVTNLTGFNRNEMLSLEEIRKRDKVRAAARERQRKHRQQVKMRKLRDMNLDVSGSDMSATIEDMYRMHSDGQFQQVLHDLQQQPVAHEPNHLSIPSSHELPPPPQGQPQGGQTFASTLLLSFSCAPLLKQHLLRTLSMTNEELASLEPILAEAWDNWDRNRRIHYEQAKAVFPSFPVDLNQPNHFVHALPHNGTEPNAPPNEFRERFARSLVTPSPFAPPALPQISSSSTPGASSSTDTLANDDADTIDPHLSSGTMDPSSPPTTASTDDSA